MQIENLINKSTDTKNTDTKTINDMTAGMRVSDYIKTDSSDNMSKKAAVVGSSNSVDMSDTIYARPQAKNEAGNNDGTDMACLLYTSPSPRDGLLSRMPSSA